jgi:hypothetical protein
MKLATSGDLSNRTDISDPRARGQPAYDGFAIYYDASDLDRGPEIAFYKSLVHENTRALLERVARGQLLQIWPVQLFRDMARPLAS